MHEHLGSFTQNPSQKFHKNFINFEKHQKHQNLDLNVWNAWRMSEREIVPSDLRQEKAKNHVGLREKRVFGRWKDRFYRERSGRSEEKSCKSFIYKNHKAQQIERCREVSRFKTHEKAIEGLSRICREVSTAKGCRWIEKLLRIYRVSRKFLDGSSNYWEIIENAIKSNQKGLIDSLAVERCPTAVEIA